MCPRGRVLRRGGRGGGAELVRAAELPRARRHRPHEIRPRHALPGIQPQVRFWREIQNSTRLYLYSHVFLSG